MQLTSSKYQNAIIQMLTKSSDKDSYLFYANIISKCKIIEDKTISTLGVNFNNKWNLYINSDFLDSLPENQIKGVLCHEAMHILLKHQFREPEKDYNKKLYNVACDISINQLINPEDLPEGALYPINYDLPENLTAEQYYFLLKKEDLCDSNHKSSTESIGVHNWEETNKVDEELVNDITKNMIEESIESTLLCAGKLPKSANEYLSLFSNKSILSWKQLLRRYTGNKKSSTKKTYKRRARRFHNRMDVKGKKSDNTFNILVITDVSGSMKNEDIILGLNEIYNIAKVTNSDLRLIQVDTEAYLSEEFKRNQKLFNRKASGGTELFKGVIQAKEEKLDYDVLIVVTDMELFNSDIDNFSALKKKQIWINTRGKGKKVFNSNQIREFDLT